MFPPGKSGQEIWSFEISRFPESLCRDPGKCLHISKDFQGRAQEFEKKGGAQLSRPFSVQSQVKSKKIGRHVRRCPIFRLKSSEEQKEVITPSDCPLYVYHL